MLAQPENRGGDLWLRRRFARPTGLEPHTAVTLCIAGAVAGGVVRLNDNELGRLPARGNLVRFDVTRMLLPRNQLVLKCPLPAPSDSVEQAGQPLMGQVGLEIESA